MGCTIQWTVAAAEYSNTVYIQYIHLFTTSHSTPVITVMRYAVPGDCSDIMQ